MPYHPSNCHWANFCAFALLSVEWSQGELWCSVAGPLFCSGVREVGVICGSRGDRGGSALCCACYLALLCGTGFVDLSTEMLILCFAEMCLKRPVLPSVVLETIWWIACCTCCAVSALGGLHIGELLVDLIQLQCIGMCSQNAFFWWRCF